MRSTSNANLRVGRGMATLALVVLVGGPQSGGALVGEEEPLQMFSGPLVAPDIEPPWASPREAPRDGPSITFEERVLELVNQARLANGNLPPLKGVAELHTAAGTHSFNMADRDFFAHCDLDTGTLPGDRMIAAGYFWSFLGENIAAGFTSPEVVMDAWMGSPGHRANILHTGFREIGVGYFLQPGDQPNVRFDIGGCSAGPPVNGPYFRYWTQKFGRRNDVYPLVINREAHDTICAGAALYVYGPPNATQMRFSNDGVNWAPLEPYSAHKGWSLTGSSGSSTTVYSEVIGGGQTFPGSDSIYLGFDFPAPATLNLPNQVVGSTESFVACHTISAIQGFSITASGDVTFRSGRRMVLGSGFSVASGGAFRALVDPNL